MASSGFMLSATDQGARENNLNFLRLVAASLVTLSHAWPLTGSVGEPLAHLTGVLTFGAVAVHVFFAISGFLIAKSFDRSDGLWRFLKARALRLYPGLFVALVLSVLLIQLLAGSLSHGEYFLHPATRAYIKNNLLLNTQYELPGIFLGNHFPGSVNGSLWTLRYEVAMYLMVTLCGLLGLIRRPFWFNLLSMPLVGGIIVAALTMHKPFGNIPDDAIVMAVCFYLGTAMYVNRQHVLLDLRLAAALWLVTYLAKGSLYFHPLYSVALSYSVLLAGFLPRLQSSALSLRNDYSYGIYIYSFPVQQLLVHFQPQLGPWTHFGLAYLIALPFAVASWHLVEKPALKMK